MKVNYHDTFIEIVPENTMEKAYVEKFKNGKFRYDTVNVGNETKTINLVNLIILIE